MPFAITSIEKNAWNTLLYCKYTQYWNLFQSYIKNKALDVYNIILITNKTNYAIDILAQAS